MDDPTRDLYRVTRPDGTITYKSARDYGRPEHGASTSPTWETRTHADGATFTASPATHDEYASFIHLPAAQRTAWLDAITSGIIPAPTDAEGLPVRPDGRRYAMTEPHPFVLTPNVAARGPVCHLCNGTRDYVAHRMVTLGSAVITGTGQHGRIVHLYTDAPTGVRCAYVRLDSGRKSRFVLSDLRAAE